MEIEIEEECLKILALHQPVARDLRLCSTSYHVCAKILSEARISAWPITALGTQAARPVQAPEIWPVILPCAVSTCARCKHAFPPGGFHRTGPLAAGPAVMHIKPRVMLNNGPYIVQALRALDNVLLCMQDHQYKKNPLLHALQLASAQIDEKSGSKKPFSKDTA
jgi:hypothetical protein